jgi:hypothetical protein
MFGKVLGPLRSMPMLQPLRGPYRALVTTLRLGRRGLRI